MNPERVRSTSKQLICFGLMLAMLLTLASLWLPVEGHGRPSGQGGYLTTFEFGVLRFAVATCDWSPTRYSADFSTKGFWPLAFTIGLTSLLLWLVRMTSRWCARS